MEEREIKHLTSTMDMENYTFCVGQEFSDVKSFRKTIREAAIAQHFELRIIKSDLIRFFAKCAKDGCPWRIRAVKLPNVPTFTIRSLEETHTCGRTAHLGHQQASVDWIVNFIEERLRDNLNYKPKDILQDIQRQYGITIPYKQAWRAKERGLAAIYGSSEEGYCLLPQYCEQIEQTNPGSIAEVFTTGPEHRFQRLFIAFHASIYGFINGCLPLVGLGGIQLKSKYLGTLLSATSFDADGALFPLAFGVVDAENDDSWMWFLTELHKMLEMNTDKIPKLTILSDGQKGIVDAVRRKFPSAAHGICMRHLTESIGKEFKNSRLVHLLWKAAFSITTVGFKERMAEIEELSADAARWVEQVPPSRWAVPYFEGARFGHLSSNIEEFNRWIVDARELPVIQVLERIHSKLMAEFNERCEKANACTSVLAPNAERRMSEAIARASGYQVLRSDEVEFEVISAERSNIVNIGTRSCSCRDWQLYGLPCSHAVAALLSCKKDIYEFSEKCFTVAKYRETYSQPINLVPDKRLWNKSDEGSTNEDNRLTVAIRPPKFRRPPGRPEKKRLCIEDLNREKHTVHCSRCNQTGHYKTTCKAEEPIKTIEPKRQKLLYPKVAPQLSSDSTLLSQLQLKPSVKMTMIGTVEDEIFVDQVDAPEVIDDFELGQEDIIDIKDNEVNKQKLKRRINHYKIKLLNPCRQGKKLLVLDIDYTLFDHRSKAENPLELMRPFLHEFLSAAYAEYDIIIWSATSMKWVELKMEQLGVLTHPNYKITSLLDHLAMITVQSDSRGIFDCKPLGLIWALFPEFYNSKNTIMFDDLRRNFVMNPQNGLVIRPFRKAHLNRSNDQELVRLTRYLLAIAEFDDLSSLNHDRWESFSEDSAKRQRHG